MLFNSDDAAVSNTAIGGATVYALQARLPEPDPS